MGTRRRIVRLIALVVGVALGADFVFDGAIALSRIPGEYPNWVLPVVAGGCLIAASILAFIGKASPKRPSLEAGSRRSGETKRWPPAPKIPEH